MQRGVLVSAPWSWVAGCVRMAQSCAEGYVSVCQIGFEGKSLHCDSDGTDFLVRWLMPLASQCSRGTWTMPFRKCFNLFVSLEVLRQVGLDVL